MGVYTAASVFPLPPPMLHRSITQQISRNAAAGSTRWVAADVRRVLVVRRTNATVAAVSQDAAERSNEVRTLSATRIISFV